MFEAGGLRGEEDAAGFGEAPVVFEADAKLAGEVDAGFVGEAHAGGERGLVAAHEVGPLVHVHADTVADAVREGFIVGAEAGRGDDLAGGVVDGVAGNAGLSGGERGGLGAVDDVEDLFLPVGWLAVDEAAGDIGLVAFDGAAVVDEDDLAFADDLWAGAAVRERGPLAHLA